MQNSISIGRVPCMLAWPGTQKKILTSNMWNVRARSLSSLLYHRVFEIRSPNFGIIFHWGIIFMRLRFHSQTGKYPDSLGGRYRGHSGLCDWSVWRGRPAVPQVRVGRGKAGCFSDLVERHYQHGRSVGGGFIFQWQLDEYCTLL